MMDDMPYVFTDECDEPHELNLDKVNRINWWPDEFCMVVMRDGSVESFMLSLEAFGQLEDALEKHRKSKESK